MVNRIALIGVILAITASPVWACGILLSADPKVGSSVQPPVDHLSIHFSQATIPAESSISVTDAAGKPLPAGPLAAHEKDSVLSVAMQPPLKPGTYKVRWNIMWKECHNATQGDYKFTVQP